MKNLKFSNIKKPILIAEISANHNGSLTNAKKLIKTAKLNNADFVKLQTYEARNMTIKSKRKEFVIKEGIWKKNYLWDLYSKSSMSYDLQMKIFKFCKKL